MPFLNFQNLIIMRIHFNLLYNRVTQLVVAGLLIVSLTSSHPKAHMVNSANEALIECVLHVDGTQLAQEAKAFKSPLLQSLPCIVANCLMVVLNTTVPFQSTIVASCISQSSGGKSL